MQVGEVAFGADVLRAGHESSSAILGPRIRARIASVHDANLDATLIPSRIAKSFVISRTVENPPDVRPGDEVTLIVSPDEHEVFVIQR